jgi:hypothetical protein
MNKKKSNLPNFIFSVLVILNIIVFLLVLPAFIYQVSHDKLSHKEASSLSVFLIVMVIYLFYSYMAYYRGINLPDLEGRPSVYGLMSGGDKEFFAFFSKPIAYLLQFFIMFLLTGLLIKLYK